MSSGTKIKVLSYNIHKGFTFSRRFVLDNIRSAIRATKADLVFLQEVLGRHDVHKKRIPTWPQQTQFEYLADRIWPHFAYGENAVYSSGHHGNAILSKFPFRSTENIDISMTRYARRGLLHGVIEVPGVPRPVHVICLHLDLRKADRSLQAELIIDRISSSVPRKCPLIIAGDFNDWQQRITAHFEEALGLKETYMEVHRVHARTFPSRLPTLKLDRIYCRGVNVREAKCFSRSPWNKLSDHLAVFAEVELSVTKPPKK